MKQLIDGIEVPESVYYYLLDFNERYNWEYLRNVLNKERLCDLNIDEFRKMFEHATWHDDATIKGAVYVHSIHLKEQQK